MQIKKAILIIVGCIGLGLGAVGAVVPLLPSFPFLMLAAVCFAKSSERLDTWFRSTKLYKDNLESYVKGEGMHKSAKKRVVGMISALMAIGFIIMLFWLFIICHHAAFRITVVCEKHLFDTGQSFVYALHCLYVGINR